jgi:hypothetical protein
VCLGLDGTLGPSVLGVAQPSNQDEEDNGPWFQACRLGNLSPLIADFDDLGKAKEAASVVNFALRERGLECG